VTTNQEQPEINSAFNQWASHLVARVKSQVTTSNLPLIFSYCCACGKGLGAVNGNRIGHCSDAGEQCQPLVLVITVDRTIEYRTQKEIANEYWRYADIGVLKVQELYTSNQIEK
jgi:hypothetical protein